MLKICWTIISQHRRTQDWISRFGLLSIVYCLYIYIYIYIYILYIYCHLFCNVVIVFVVCTAGHRKIATLFFVSECSLLIEWLVRIHESINKNQSFMNKLYSETHQKSVATFLWPTVHRSLNYSLMISIKVINNLSQNLIP